MSDLFIPPAPTISLRPYQHAATKAICQNLVENSSTLLVAATGTGKTVIICQLASLARGRVLVIAHREELIFQAAKRLEAFGISVDIEMGDIRASEWSKPKVIVATVQTLNSRRIHRFDPNEFSLVVFDESHRCVSKTYKNVLNHFRQNQALKIVGVTATPDRSDEEALGQVFDTVAFEYEIVDAIQDGFLVPIEQMIVQIESLDFSNVRTTAGDLNGADLATVMETEKNLHGIASATLDIAKDKRCIVFTASVKQAETLTEIFNRHQPGSSGWACGKTPKDKRQALLSSFANGSIQRIVNCGLWIEGFDEPTIEAVINACPTKSRARYAQTIGRGTRPLPGVIEHLDTPEERREAIASSKKPSLTVLDFAGNSGRHKLMTTGDILGGKVSDEAVELAKERARNSSKPTDMLAQLEQAQRDIEERKRLDMAKKAKLVGTAKFSARKVNPFDVFDLEPEKSRGWDNVKKLSEKQRAILDRNGIDPNDVGFSQGSQLISEIFRRREDRLCSYKQLKLLKKHGVDAANMDFTQASAEINRIASNGWKA